MELLRYGADVSIANKEGSTPLIAATCRKHYRIVNLLLAEGADITKQNKDGQTALSLAQSNVLALLSGANTDSTILKAIIQGDSDRVQRLLEANRKEFPDHFSEESAPTLASKTPFMVACSLGLSDDALMSMLGRHLPVGEAFGRGPQFFDFKNNDLSFPSVRYKVPIFSARSGAYDACKVYFECKLRSRGVVRIGIASGSWRPKKVFLGIGNDDQSYGLDGWQGCVWFERARTLRSDVRWDKEQVIGVTIDTAEERVSFHKNGVPIEGIPDMDLSTVFGPDGVVPVCSFDNKMEAVFNFGSHAFKYPPSRRASASPGQWMSVDDYYRKHHADSSGGLLTIACAPPRCLELYDVSIGSWKAVTSASRLMRPCPAYDWCWAVSQDEPRVVRLVSRMLTERPHQVWELAAAEDENGRKAIDIAAPSCRWVL